MKRRISTAVRDLNISSPESPSGRQDGDHLTGVPALLCSCCHICPPGPSPAHTPSDSVSAILMLEHPHGWTLAASPQRTKALLRVELSASSCTKAGQRRTNGGRRKVKSSGTAAEQAEPRGTCALQLQADNRQHPDYENAFSIVHQIVWTPG